MVMKFYGITRIFESGIIRFFFKKWHQSGIKYVKDIYDHEQQNFNTFGILREKYNLASAEFLKHLNILHSIPKERCKKIL